MSDCSVDKYGSRVCERGTVGCFVKHERPTWAYAANMTYCIGQNEFRFEMKTPGGQASCLGKIEFDGEVWTATIDKGTEHGGWEAKANYSALAAFACVFKWLDIEDAWMSWGKGNAVAELDEELKSLLSRHAELEAERDSLLSENSELKAAASKEKS